MDYVYSIVLGIVQGLTEFLPISSSGHLVLLERIFDKPSLFFNVMLHAATLLSVFVVMRKRLWQLIKNPLSPENIFVLISMLPTAFIAALFKWRFESVLEGSLLPLGFALTTALLVFPTLKKDGLPLSCPRSFISGIAQGIAVIPGLSRSGTVISTLRIIGTPVEKSVEFAFLMSIPVIIGSTGVELFTADAIYMAKLPSVLTGMAFAFLTGIFALKFMLSRLNGKNIRYFAPYTFVLFILACFI